MKQKLLLMFVCTLLAATSFAQTSGSCGPNLTWTFEESTGTLTISGEGMMTEFSINAPDPWSLFNTQITHVVIEDGVVSIALWAFRQCHNLTTLTIKGSSFKYFGSTYLMSMLKELIIADGDDPITLPDHLSVNGIEKLYMGRNIINISSFYSLYHSNSSLKELTIGGSVTSINDAFSNCTGLTDLTIGNSVTTIGESAFDGCTDLTSVNIGNSVATIGRYAFLGCTGLTSVSIGNSVTTIDMNAFDGCTGLTAIEVASDNPNYSSLDGVLFDKEYTSIILYPIGKQDATYTIPNSVTSIGYGAFQRCGLTSIDIPNSVTTIKGAAFQNCWGLTSVAIPNSVTNIEGSAFSYCPVLEQVTVEWETPLEISNSVFVGSDVANSKLIVPAGTADLYRAAPVWQDFTIEEGNAISTIALDNSPVISTQYYDLNAQEVTNPQQGQMYIVKELHQSGQTTVKKIVVND